MRVQASAEMFQTASLRLSRFKPFSTGRRRTIADRPARDWWAGLGCAVRQCGCPAGNAPARSTHAPSSRQQSDRLECLGHCLSGREPQETDRIRVYEYTAKKGDQVPAHTHPTHVVYLLQPRQTKFTLADGSQPNLERMRPGMRRSIRRLCTRRNTSRTCERFSLRSSAETERNGRLFRACRLCARSHQRAAASVLNATECSSERCRSRWARVSHRAAA